MNKILVTLLLFIVFSSSNSQPLVIEWQKGYGSLSRDIGWDFKKTLDGGYVLTGAVYANGKDVTGYHASTTDWADVWVVKLDANKNIQWQKCYGGTRFDGVEGIVQLPDSGFIVYSITQSIDGDLTGIKTHTGYQGRIFRISKTGNIIWNRLTDAYQADNIIEIDKKYYFFEGANSSSRVGAIDTAGNITTKMYASNIGGEYTFYDKLIKTYDKGFLFVGGSSKTIAGSSVTNGGGDVYVVKVDSNFSTVWQKLLGTQYNDGGEDVIQTRDSGYLIVGYTILATGATNLPGHHGGYDYYAIKINKLGQKQWHKYIGGSKDETICGVVDDKNGYILYGNTISNNGDVVVTTPGLGDISKPFLAKIDSANGNLMWTKTYGGSWDDYIYKIERDSDSSFLFCGDAGSKDGDINFAYFGEFWFGRFKTPTNLPSKLIAFEASINNNNILLNWKTENEVNVLQYNIQRSENGSEFKNIGFVKSNCCLYQFVDEKVQDLIKNTSTLFYRLETVDKDGTRYYSKIISVKLQSTTDNQLIYPNPAKNELFIKGNYKEIKILNTNGQILVTQKTSSNQSQHKIDISNMVSGNYIVQCIKSDNTVQIEKLTILH